MHIHAVFANTLFQLHFGEVKNCRDWTVGDNDLNIHPCAPIRITTIFMPEIVTYFKVQICVYLFAIPFATRASVLASFHWTEYYANHSNKSISVSHMRL